MIYHQLRKFEAATQNRLKFPLEVMVCGVLTFEVESMAMRMQFWTHCNKSVITEA